MANRRLGREHYSWVLVGEGGDSVSSSTATSFKLDEDLNELHRDDTIVLCGGINIQAATTKKLLNWLRREARKGPAIAGLCTASFTMAIKAFRKTRSSGGYPVIESSLDTKRSAPFCFASARASRSLATFA